MLNTAEQSSVASTLDEDDLCHLRRIASAEQFAPGEMLLRFGQADVDLFVVERGRIEVLNPTAGDARIAVRGPGEFLGDIDLITRRPIVYSVRSLGDDDGGPARVLRVPGNRVRLLLNAVPHVGEKLIATFQKRRQSLAGTDTLGLKVTGPAGCIETHRVREFLHKNFVPFCWNEAGAPGEPQWPTVDFGGGHIQSHPALADVARAAGVLGDCPDRDVEFAVVGAGPAGIAAAVYAASEGVSTIVLDRLGPGGQIGGSSRIENFIGFPAGLAGNDLATRGVLQMFKFGAELIAPISVDRFASATEPGGLHELHLDCGSVIRARTVLAATGVSWRRLPARNAERFERAGVYYTCTSVESTTFEHADVAVVGGGNSAGQAVMFLADRHADRTVHLLVRRPLEATMSDYLIQRISTTSNVIVHVGVEIASVEGDDRLQTAELINVLSRQRSTLPVGAIFVFIGAAPHADWLPAEIARDGKGFVLTGTDVVAANRWPLTDRAPCPLETSIPGLLAGGDVRAGSTKRVGFAVGDGSLAVTCAHHLRELSRDTSAERVARSPTRNDVAAAVH